MRALGLRFDPTLTFTGGTDALFFRQMKLAGCRIVYAADARVREIVPPERATLRLSLAGPLQAGLQQGAAQAATGEDGRRPLGVASAWSPSGFPGNARRSAAARSSVARSLLTGHADMGHLSGGLLRVAKGLGGLAGLLGVRFAHYR